MFGRVRPCGVIILCINLIGGGALLLSITMGYPAGYKDIAAHESSIAKAREVKEDLDLTWNQFLKRGAAELDANSD